MKKLVGRMCSSCRGYFFNDQWDGDYCCPACKQNRPPERADAVRQNPSWGQKRGRSLLENV
jgi:uncharacterized Zn finger protein (UPF0148 family)